MNSLGRYAGLVSFLTLAAGYVASGCGPSDDRYYCDSAGCWSCDGYGCTAVAAPATVSCTGQSACASGTVCTDTGCLKPCSGDAECDRGTVCKSSFCTAPTASPPGNKKECTTKSDCGGGGKLCVQGTCQSCGGSSGACPCSAATDCNADQTCSNGSCVAKSSVCKYASECAQGQSCVDGACVTPCSDDGACGANASCQSGFCHPKPPSTTCTSDAQCSGDTPKCLAGKCGHACTGDAECGTGNYCNQGACTVDTRPKPICTATDKSACSANQSCVDGYCKYTCGTDNDCKLIDARIGYCGTDHVCRTQAEAHPGCTQKSDCSGNQSCVDNVCK